MAFEGQISDLMREDNIDANKILSELLDAKNINLKTDIPDPITFAILESIVWELENMLSAINEKKLRLPILKGTLRKIIRLLKEFSVSWERKSRIEITETLKASKEEGTGAQSFFQKLSGFVK